MKATELRIGNLVQVKEDNGNIETYEVVEMGIEFNDSPYSLSLRDKNSMFLTDFPIEDVIPIPITEDWMINLGFKRSGFNFDLSNVQIIYEKENEFRFAYTCSGIRFQNVYFNRQIKYVHQLQNLYFTLIGEELKNLQ